jgi:hypothetical protein
MPFRLFQFLRLFAKLNIFSLFGTRKEKKFEKGPFFEKNTRFRGYAPIKRHLKENL